MDEQKEKLLDFIETTRQLFDDIINTVESYLNSYIMIEKGLIRRYNRQELNYQLIRNLRNKKLFDNYIFQKLEELDKKPDLNKKFNSLFNDIYTPINTAKQKKDEKEKPKIIQIPNNTMIITYNIAVPKLERRVKLFDQVFVENNKDKLSLEIEGVRKGKPKKEKKELVVYYNNDLDYQNFKVTLSQIGNKPFITDMSYMFNNCKYLQSVDFKGWQTNNITSMEAMFQLCKLEKLPDISNFNTTNLENIRAMFCKCTKMKDKDIPNMNKWFTNKDSKLSNISMLFNGCKSLTSITFSKNWYTTKLEDMSYMFNNCLNLKEIHNLKIIQNQSSNVKSMCGLFNGCKELIESNDLKAPNVEDLSIMFQGCKKLTKVKNNSFGENKSLKDISGMFSGCSSLKKDINTGIANTDKVTNVTGLFKNCENLEGLADIGKWNMGNVKKYKGMFYGCKKLKEPRGINKWKFNKDTKYEQIVENSSLDGLKAAWQGNEAKNTIDN